MILRVLGFIAIGFSSLACFSACDTAVRLEGVPVSGISSGASGERRGESSENSPVIAPDEPSRASASAGFHDFGDPNFHRVIQKMQALRNHSAPPGTVLRIVQFGDSHTASDTMTSELRRLLQGQMGDAGVGWVAPMGAKGQYHALIRHESKGWELTTSRSANDEKQKIFPLGGYIATPEKRGAEITIIPRNESDGLWKTRLAIKQWKSPLTLTDANNKKIVIRPLKPFGLWRDLTLNAALRLPLTIRANSPGDADFGGLWLERDRASGVTVSSIGLNGVGLKHWEYWSTPHQWTRQLTASQSDMVIIAYGTNEAFVPETDVAQVKKLLKKGVQTVRESLPGVSIVIVGAPDAIHDKEAQDCGERISPLLRQVKRAQLEVARETQTLFWDWQAAMGGPCGMDAWNNEGLAKKDLVHLNWEGYQKSARIFYDDLMGLIDEFVEREQIRAVLSKEAELVGRRPLPVR